MQPSILQLRVKLLEFADVLDGLRAGADLQPGLELAYVGDDVGCRAVALSLDGHDLAVLGILVVFVEAEGFQALSNCCSDNGVAVGGWSLGI